jgi:ATP-binding cassette, subfamily B, bacterial
MGKGQKQSRRSIGSWRVLRCFWPYARRQWRLVAGAFLALMAEVALRLIEPWPLKVVFDYAIVPRPDVVMPSLPLIGTIGAPAILVLAALATVLLIGWRAIVAYSHTVGFALAGNRVCRELRDTLFRHVQSLPLSFHTRARSGDLLLRVIGDAGMLRDVVITAAVPLLANVVVFATMVAVMCWLRWDLAILALGPAPLFFLSTTRVTARISHVSRNLRQSESVLAASASEAIGAVRTVQSLSLEDRFSKAFHVASDAGLQSGVQGTRLAARLERSTDVFVGLSTALVILYGAFLVLHSHLTPGDLIVFLAYLKTAVKPVKDVAKYTGRIAKARAAAERIVEVLDLVPEIRNRPDARTLTRVRGHIRFDGVSFGYDAAHPILHGIDFEVRPGEKVALVGRSGRGKSTIASLLLRLYEPTCGRVLIDGSDIREYTLESLRGQIASVFQNSPLFAVSVWDNIAMGAPSASDADVRAAAALGGALEFIEKLPHRFQTLVGERGHTLSEGQRQRLALARAAVRQASICVLDEPTAGLDEENQRVIVDAIESLARVRTVLLITHDLALAARADRILHLDDGRVTEEGTHSQLLMAAGEYARLYRLQVDERASETARLSHAV